MSGYPAGPPPPYPGTDAGAAGGYPPSAPTYSDPSKGLTGYNDPAQPGGGYSQPGAYSQPVGGYPQSSYPQSSYPQSSYPQQSYPQQPAVGGYTHSTTTVVVNQPALAVVQTFREFPVHCTCPHCRAEVVTGTHFETGTLTWVLCCVIFLVGFALGCCFIPFCIDGCKDVIHTCPNCHQQIARYNRM